MHKTCTLFASFVLSFFRSFVRLFVLSSLVCLIVFNKDKPTSVHFQIKQLMFLLPRKLFNRLKSCNIPHQALDKMESEWKPVMLEVMPYKDTGTFIMKVSDDCSQLLDDHIVMAQSMSFSPYKKPFEERITTWESKLVMTQDVMDEWLQCQRAWLYLEPIFSSEDINRQLPVESKRYQTMERIWRKVMNSAKSNPQVRETTVCFELVSSFLLPAAHKAKT